MKLLPLIFILAAAEASADKWDLMVCETEENEAVKTQCISDAKAKIESERKQKELLRESEKRLAAEQAREQDANRIYGEQCQNDFDCWVNSKSDLLQDIDAKSKCDQLIERHAKYQFKWNDGWGTFKYSRIYKPQKGMHSYTVGYAGDAVLFQNGFGAWQPHSYLCWYDYLQKDVISIKVIEGKGVF